VNGGGAPRVSQMPSSGLAPDLLELLDQRPLERASPSPLAEIALAGLVQRVHHLAIDVELQLAVRGVADAHRARPQ
jgi:hypothetical protein